MRWPDSLDIGIGLDSDRCISEIPRHLGVALEMNQGWCHFKSKTRAYL